MVGNARSDNRSSGRRLPFAKRLDGIEQKVLFAAVLRPLLHLVVVRYLVRWADFRLAGDDDPVCYALHSGSYADRQKMDEADRSGTICDRSMFTLVDHRRR